MAFRRGFPIVACFQALLGLALMAPGVSWAGFQPVSPEELKMTSEPMAPGAPAIILYRQVDRDDSRLDVAHEYNYVRIKILSEEGRRYADVELPFFKGDKDIGQIHARTVKPDGTIVDFDGKVFEKVLAKGHEGAFLAKTFTLPDVQVGGLIEYFYTVDFKYVFESHWILSQSLLTKSAHFSLKPFSGNAYYPVGLRWSWQGLPPGSEPKMGADHIMRLEMSNIPAFQTEDYMPPENELKIRVDIFYEEGNPETDPEKFWRQIGKKRNGNLESFIGKRKAMEQAVALIVSPEDAPEVKLRKIYDRVQAIRNKSFELSKTAQEEKRDKEKRDENVEDIWKRGYGDGGQLTWLYLALARAAGFEAYGCWVSSRNEYFFHAKTMESRTLNANIVLVKLNGKDLYFDPGAEFTPFAMLEWSETGVVGLRLDKDGGTWIQTTMPQSSESRVERKAKFKLSDNGDLEGKLTLTYVGLEAMNRRLNQRHADEVARKKFMEESAQALISQGSEAELTNKPDWNSSETPLVAEFDIKVPGWGSGAGRRMMIPAGVFTAHEKHIFEHANRVYPIYFDFPYERLDEVSIELPPGWKISSIPPPQNNDSQAVSYDLKVENDKETLRLTRKLAVNLVLLDVKFYPTLRNFFELVRTGDEEQIVLQPGTATAAN